MSGDWDWSRYPGSGFTEEEWRRRKEFHDWVIGKGPRPADTSALELNVRYIAMAQASEVLELEVARLRSLVYEAVEWIEDDEQRGKIMQALAR